jgi:hypothetical protein
VKVNWRRSLACARYGILLGSDDCISLLSQLYYDSCGVPLPNEVEGNRMISYGRAITAYSLQTRDTSLGYVGVAAVRQRLQRYDDGVVIQRAAESLDFGSGGFERDEKKAMELYHQAHELYVCFIPTHDDDDDASYQH